MLKLVAVMLLAGGAYAACGITPGRYQIRSIPVTTPTPVCVQSTQFFPGGSVVSGQCGPSPT
ncbi:hypothetical protein BGX24_001634, partial [Mortierella sp. AD032]